MCEKDGKAGGVTQNIYTQTLCIARKCVHDLLGTYVHSSMSGKSGGIIYTYIVYQ